MKDESFADTLKSLYEKYRFGKFYVDSTIQAKVLSVLKNDDDNIIDIFNDTYLGFLDPVPYPDRKIVCPPIIEWICRRASNIPSSELKKSKSGNTLKFSIVKNSDIAVIENLEKLLNHYLPILHHSTFKNGITVESHCTTFDEQPMREILKQTAILKNDLESKEFKYFPKENFITDFDDKKETLVYLLTQITTKYNIQKKRHISDLMSLIANSTILK